MGGSLNGRRLKCEGCSWSGPRDRLPRGPNPGRCGAGTDLFGLYALQLIVPTITLQPGFEVGDGLGGAGTRARGSLAGAGVGPARLSLPPAPPVSGARRFPGI